MLRRRHHARGASLAALLGADLLHHWQVSSDTVTLNGSNVSQLADRVGGKNLIQATAASQPEYQATGGPLSKPCINVQAFARILATATLGIASGTRPGIYAVFANVGGSGFRQCWSIASGGGGSHALPQNAVAYQIYSCTTLGASFVQASSPALTSGFVFGSMEYFNTGTTVRINGPTTSTLSGGSAANTLGALQIGVNPNGGGRLCMLAVVANASIAKRDIVAAHVDATYGAL